MDGEELKSHKTKIIDDYGNWVEVQTYQGKRVKRGLFQSKDGHLLNADVNGSFNIGRKACGKMDGNINQNVARRVYHDLYQWYIKHPVEALAVRPVRVVLRTNK